MKSKICCASSKMLKWKYLSSFKFKVNIAWYCKSFNKFILFNCFSICCISPAKLKEENLLSYPMHALFCNMITNYLASERLDLLDFVC